VHVLTADGGAVAGWPHDLGVATLASPAVADLDGGGGLEILVADDGGGLSALDAGGQLLWHVQRVLGGPSSPALGDLDGAGGLEVVVGSMDGKVYAFDASGQAVPGWPVSTGSAVLGSPALGDVDGDGAAEVFIGSFDTSVHAWRGDAQVIPGFGDTAFPCSVGAAIFSSPALGDIDQDTHVEVLLGSYSRQLFRATAAGSVAAGSVPWPEFRGGGGHQGATGAGLMPRLPTDLSLSLTDGVDEVLPGQDVAYKLAIQNVGPNAADGAELTLEVGPNLSECTWTCASLPGGLCPSGAGVGSIDLRVDLPVNGRLGFEVDCRVVDEVVGDQVVVHAAIGIPADRFDLDTSDNQAVDVNLNAGGLIFADGFEGGDTLRWSSTVEDP
ncbi:MAG: FG-GAP-like repeat-containing protein, partial [Acidobacteriota bacterium]